MASALESVKLLSKSEGLALSEKTEEWPDEFLLEVQQLESYSAVISGSVQAFFDKETNRPALLAFKVRRDQATDDIVNDVFDIEPVALRYSGEIGAVVPDIYSERIDFPRNLPHSNPVRSDEPVCFCLSRTSVQAVYDQGVVALIDRITQWLFDAAYDNLDKDGWEPTLQVGGYSAMADIAYFQELSNKKSGPFRQPIYGEFHDLANQADSRLRASFLNIKACVQQNTTRGIPGFYIGGDPKRIQQSYCSDPIASEVDVMSLVESIGAKQQFSYILEKELPRLTPFENGIRYLLLIFGVWRPKELRQDIPGLSNESKARQVELIAFVMFFPGSENIQADVAVKYINLWAKSTPRLLSKLSGLPEKNSDSIAYVGCGALGSVLAKNSVRAGYKHLTLIDYDHFLPHNIARHVLTHEYIGANKALALKDYFKSENVDCSAKPSVLSETILSSLSDSTKYIVDTSTNRHVRNILSLSKSSVPVAQAFITDSGKLGICLTENKNRSSRIDDIHAALYGLAETNDAVRHWLRHGTQLDEVALGLGCASNTMVLPLSRVEAIAGSFASVIEGIEDRYNGLIALTSFDPKTGLPTGSALEQIPEFKEIALEQLGSNETSWRCRISHSVVSQLVEQCSFAAPNEAGGFIYGRINTITKTVTVIHEIMADPITNSPTGIVLPPVDDSKEHTRYIRKTCGLTLNLGSWHSHPNGVTAPSKTDLAAMKRASQNVSNNFMPSLALIVGRDRAISGTLIFPRPARKNE